MWKAQDFASKGSTILSYYPIHAVRVICFLGEATHANSNTLFSMRNCLTLVSSHYIQTGHFLHLINILSCVWWSSLLDNTKAAFHCPLPPEGRADAFAQVLFLGGEGGRLKFKCFIAQQIVKCLIPQNLSKFKG